MAPSLGCPLELLPGALQHYSERLDPPPCLRRLLLEQQYLLPAVREQPVVAQLDFAPDPLLDRHLTLLGCQHDCAVRLPARRRQLVRYHWQPVQVRLGILGLG